MWKRLWWVLPMIWMGKICIRWLFSCRMRSGYGRIFRLWSGCGISITNFLKIMLLPMLPWVISGATWISGHLMPPVSGLLPYPSCMPRMWRKRRIWWRFLILTWNPRKVIILCWMQNTYTIEFRFLYPDISIKSGIWSTTGESIRL